MKDKPWLTKKCECGKWISYISKRCMSCSKKGDLNPARKKEVRDKLREIMKSPERQGNVKKWQEAGIEAIKRKSLEKFKTNPTIRIGKRGYKIIYIPQEGWMYYHHYIFCKQNNIQEIPKGYCVHHIDGNPLNNDLSNLKMMTRKEHDKLSGEERRGKPKSEETKRKISKSLKGIKHTEERRKNISNALKEYWEKTKKSKNI